jgi:hypothetical protein
MAFIVLCSLCLFAGTSLRKECQGSGPKLASRDSETHCYKWQASIGDSDKTEMLRSLTPR